MHDGRLCDDVWSTTDSRFGKRQLPEIPLEEHFQKVRLQTPVSDKDKIETNLEQDRREAFELKLNEETPKLTTKDNILASDYFRYGWEAAIAKYSKLNTETTEIKICNAFSDDELKTPTLKGVEFTETNMLKALIMAQTGTAEQKTEAANFFTQLLNRT